MRIRDGKFHNNMHDVKAEFGNPIQIMLVKQAERRRELFINGLLVPVTYYEPKDTEYECYIAIIRIECVCGLLVKSDFYVDEKSPEELRDEEFWCSCGKEYICIIDDHQLKVKLIEE